MTDADAPGAAPRTAVRIEVPRLALVVLVGPAGAGKTTFARAHFRPTEVLSSDALRAMVSDREGDLSATADAFEVLHLVAGLRLRRRRLTVVDAVSARPADRRPLLRLAAEHDCAAVAVVFDLAVRLCVERDRGRGGRTVGEAAISAQRQALTRSLPGLREEGFGAVHVLGSPEAVASAVVRRVALPVERRWDAGPFDVIGEVRGRLGALRELLERLGYRLAAEPHGGGAHPEGRRAVLLGDLAGPGPEGAGVLGLLMAMAAQGSALCVRGDRDDDLAAALRGDPVPDVPDELPEVRALGPRAHAFLEGLPSHLVLARGALVAVHAGIAAELLGRDSPRVTARCLRGAPGWSGGYRGRGLVVHGHEPVAEPGWRGRALDLDTGCGLGGRLTALRYPELEIVSVPE